MTTLRATCTACAPEYLERSPHLPLAHRQGLSAIQQGQSGPYGYSRSQCQRGGEQHRVNRACGTRHWPQCQQPKTPQWLQHHLDTQLPGPPVLLPCTVPEPLSPCSRSQHRPAAQAMFHASATARKRLAQDERFSGTTRPGCTGVLPPWGRPLQYHPHLHDLGPGGGLSADRSAWGPSRATFCVPVTALSPISRALCQEAMHHAGLLEHIAPQGWTIPWNSHSQANHHGPAAFTSLAPSVCKVAIAHHRLVSLTDRTGTLTYRQVGSARLRTTHLDAIAFLRRCLQHVWPEGLRNVRHFGVLHASGAVPLATIRLLMRQAPPARTTRPRAPRRPRARPAVRSGAHPCASSCVSGPPPEPWWRLAQRPDCALTSCVRHGVPTPRHPCARLPAAGDTRRLRTGAQPPASVPQTRLGAPLRPSWPGRTTV
jgi:hypothetical protein